MSCRAVCNPCVRHARLAQFPRGKFRALISWSRLGSPNMERQTAVVRSVNRCGCRTMVHEGEPSCIAMRKHIDGPARFLGRDWLDQFQSVVANHAAMLDIVLGDPLSGSPS